MKIFITGATGFIGTHLTRRLLKENHEVTILIRNSSNASDFPGTNLSTLTGDLFSRKVLEEGMKNCDWVFHLAAYAKPTSPDKTIPYRTNVEGTVNVLEAAGSACVKKVIITSTAGTMSYSRDGMPVNEETNKDPDYHTEYERTKATTEKIAFRRAGEGMNVTVVNPSRVFGPGKLSKSNSITRIMKLYGQGLWRIIPGDGTSVGNYAFIDDVVDGHIQAAIRGRSGQRYILGGENISFDELFHTLALAFGRKRIMVKVNSENLKRIAGMTGFFLSIAGKQPLISANWIDKYLQNWSLSCNKAVSELSYNITPFDQAVEKTVKWLKTGDMYDQQ